MSTLDEQLAEALERHRAGRLTQAETMYAQVLQAAPDHPAALHLLGVAVHYQGRHEEAIERIVKAIAIDGAQPVFHNNLGVVYLALKRLREAIACFERAKELEPDYAEAHSNLGIAFKEQGKLDQAIACCRQALELKPDYAEANSNLGIALKDQGKLDEAVACFQRALELNPHSAETYNNLGNARKDQGNPDEAVACYRKALELRPGYLKAHSNLLCGLQYCTGVTPQALAEAHAEFDRRHAAPLRSAIVPHSVDHDRQRSLRVGFVSPDFGKHPVGFFLVRVLENLCREKLTTICYSDRVVKDVLTRRLQAAASEWRDVAGLSHEQLAEQIRSDRIDILFDLAGHTAGNRMLVFARKPAPVQITWIGYEGTTGLSTMDFLLADRYIVPEGIEPFYQERVLRMPEGYLCFEPPTATTSVSPLPALTNGHVTFGSFNNLAKITGDVLAVWAETLRRVPTGRLLLKYRGLGDETVQRRFRDFFAARDIDPQRLEMLPWGDHVDYLNTYHRVDVALDPFPFSGSVTTCEALWMGVPVVTCPLQTFASRHSLSHLSNVGLTETIAKDLDEYVELAVTLANDLPLLVTLRAGLRERMAASPLCDGKRFADNLATLLRKVWMERITTANH